MAGNPIDNMLASGHAHTDENGEKYPEGYIDHLLEQYRVYLHIFNSTSELRHRYNEFFLGLNTAIMGIMGYIESRDVLHAPIIFTLVPMVGIAICFSWHRIISSFSQLNRAKFKVIHGIEAKLPASLFRTEWQLLGEGKDLNKYHPLSRIEKNIPVIFIVLYAVILLANSSAFSFFGLSW